MFSALLLSVTSLAHAGDKPAEKADDKPKPEVEVGGMIFAHYGVNLTDGAENFNEFAIDRAYLTAKAKITPHLGARLTLDADRMKPVETDTGAFTYDTKYRIFLKHAYLEWKDFAPGMKVRAGMTDTPYQPLADQFWDHRYVEKGLADEQGLVSTSDLGISIGGTHAKGLVDWTAGVYNGEGYSKIEVDSGKSIEARLTIDPLARGEKFQLPLTGFVDYHMNQDADPTITYVGAAGFKMPYVWVWGEYLGKSQGAVNGSGFSAALLPGVPKVARAIFRYDHWDPSTDTDKDATDKIVGGVSHNFTDKIALAATYERVTAEAAPDAPGHGIFLHLQAGF